MTGQDLPGRQMAAEIAEQPDVLSRLLSGLAEIRRVGRAVSEARPRFVLLVARGTSDHAALYAKYLVETRLGLPAGLASPSTMTTYGSRPDLRHVLVVAISQSGRSPDLVETVTVARACGAATLAVTNAPDSDLSTAADHGIDIAAGPELAVAATKTYTASLLTSWLLVDAILGGDGGAAATVPEAVAAAVTRRDEVAVFASRLRFAARVIVTGRGFSYATARETALKLMETGYLAAHAFSGADLLHGPLAMVDSSVPVVAFTPVGAGGAAMTPVLDSLSARGADISVLGVVPLGMRGLEVTTPALPEPLSPIRDAVIGQWLAHSVAVDRGLDPDHPRGLSKVTSTW